MAKLGARGGGGPAVPACDGSENNTDHMGLRILSIFVILLGSLLGAVLPVWLARVSSFSVPKHFFIIAKYFGSGAIVATAWMHLLSPASDSFRDPCLSDILPHYDWAMGIGLMAVMTMFLLEIVVSKFDFDLGPAEEYSQHEHDLDRALRGSREAKSPQYTTSGQHPHVHGSSVGSTPEAKSSSFASQVTTPHEGPYSEVPISTRFDSLPGSHLAHQHEHDRGNERSTFSSQMTAIFILEFGVIFHSIFIGLTLAVTDNFVILFVVLVFHQIFEGLGLGARLAMATWPRGRAWTPFLLAGLYGVSTPLAIAIGLLANKSLSLGAATSKIVNGVFDAVSGGILMYTGLVELLAHEFMFNPEMRRASLCKQLLAFGCVLLGVFVMALLAAWA